MEKFVKFVERPFSHKYSPDLPNQSSIISKIEI